MKRIQVLGVCLVAMLAVGALASASASASSYGQCRELTKVSTPKTKHGKYEDSSCTKLYEHKGKVEEKGNYEYFPGAPLDCVYVKKGGKYTDEKCEHLSEKKGKPVAKGAYERASCYGSGQGCDEETSATGPTKLISSAGEGTEITCKGSTDTGLITGERTGTDAVSYGGCSFEEAVCTSAGAANEGEIATYPLETSLIGHGEKGLGGAEPASGEAWEQFANQKGTEAPLIAKFVCKEAAATIYLKVSGSLSVPLTTLNLMTSEVGQKFAVGAGEQALKLTACLTATYTKCLVKEAPATETAEAASFKTATPIEIRP